MESCELLGGGEGVVGARGQGIDSPDKKAFWSHRRQNGFVILIYVDFERADEKLR